MNRRSRSVPRRLAAALLLGVIPAASGATEMRHSLSGLEPIPLTAGVNRIDHFASDGRPAIITLGWRDNGNAHGYHLFLVLMPATAGAEDWNVVGIDAAGPTAIDADTIRDDPHAGEDAVTAVRFAHARVDGEAASLLLIASRETGASAIPAPSPVHYRVYRLMPNDRAFGTADYFQRIDTATSTTPFCNAELALARQFGLPLASDYQGPANDDGCP